MNISTHSNLFAFLSFDKSIDTTLISAHYIWLAQGETAVIALSQKIVLHTIPFKITSFCFNASLFVQINYTRYDMLLF